jgi:hypothetical protein
VRYHKGEIMIEKITKLLSLRVTSDSRVATIGSIIMYIGGVAFCVLACRKLISLNLSAAQINFGLLLIVIVAMLMVVGGILLSVLGHLSDVKKMN